MKALLFFLFIFCVFDSYSQTIVNNVSGSSVTISIQGSSFTATQTGFINRIDVRNLTAFSGNLLLYNGGNGSGTGTIGTPVYQQTGISLSAITLPNWSSILLTTPFPVVAGNQYTFILDGSAAFGLYNDSGTDSYAGGELFLAYGTPATGFDLAFRIYQPAPIPVSNWAIILATISIITLFILRKRKLFSKS